MSEEWLGSDDQGNYGRPGQQYTEIFAGVRKAKNGQFELVLYYSTGSNQVHLEEHSRQERTGRCDSLRDLICAGNQIIKGDPTFDTPAFRQAIRGAVYAAQDALAK